MSKTAKMIIDKDFQISKVDERIYGSLNILDVRYMMDYISRAIRCQIMMDSVKMSLIW